MPPRTRTLTPYLRRRLKRPLGKLFTPEQIDSESFRRILRDAARVVTVGDRVTDTMEALGRTPDIQIVDAVEERRVRKAPEVPFKKLIRVKNPAGTLTSRAISAARRSFREVPTPVRILVDGEEDLMAIPALACAPDGTVIYYGQPGVGVVVVSANEESRQRATRTLEKMPPA